MLVFHQTKCRDKIKNERTINDVVTGYICTDSLRVPRRHTLYVTDTSIHQSIWKIARYVKIIYSARNK